MRRTARPSLGTVLRTFRPSVLKFAQGRRDLRRWYHPTSPPATETDYTLSGFLQTDSLFVHIPKAAGTSVTHSLYGNRAAGHIAMRNFQEFIRPSALARMYTFTFVRNPWDRIFSAYTFLKAGGWPEWDADYVGQFLNSCDSFEQFVMEILPRSDARRHIHFHTMSSFMTGLEGEWYPFDFVGRFERFADDFDHVRRRVNPAAQVEHRNPTKRSESHGYREAYSQAMIDIVGEIYSEDITALGYSFDGFEDRYPA